MQTRFFQASACANGDARKGLFGDRDSDPSFRLQAAVDPAQKRAAADEHEPSLHHIRRQLRGCALEDGSKSTIPSPFTKTTVFAVPKSTARLPRRFLSRREEVSGRGTPFNRNGNHSSSWSGRWGASVGRSFASADPLV